MARFPAMFLALALSAASPAHADAAAGKAKARACAVCHGPLGLSVLPEAPNLAAQPERYLAVQLQAFRSGKRASEVMAVVAKTLTDADIADLAAWFSSIQVEAREKP